MHTTINLYTAIAKINCALALIKATSYDASEPLVVVLRLLRAARVDIEEVAEQAGRVAAVVVLT